jgi:hypothetical protein
MGLVGRSPVSSYRNCRCMSRVNSLRATNYRGVVEATGLEMLHQDRTKVAVIAV